MSNSEYREPQQAAREAGLAKRQEQRLENATYTAAEVKVLTAKARRDAAEEIALALEAEAQRHSVPTAAMVLDAIAAPMAREIGSKEASV